MSNNNNNVSIKQLQLLFEILTFSYALLQMDTTMDTLLQMDTPVLTDQEKIPFISSVWNLDIIYRIYQEW